jgi:hypothetical protein
MESDKGTGPSFRSAFLSVSRLVGTGCNELNYEVLCWLSVRFALCFSGLVGLNRPKALAKAQQTAKIRTRFITNKQNIMRSTEKPFGWLNTRPDSAKNRLWRLT